MTSQHIDLFVSPAGTDDAPGTDTQPLPSPAAARDRLRAVRTTDQAATVHLAPGTYRLSSPLTFDARDSDTTYVADGAAGEVVIDGAAALVEWQQNTINGNTVWTTAAPSPRAKSLFVTNERRPRPRLPRDGYFRIASQDGVDPSSTWTSASLFDGAERFGYADGDARAFHDLTAVEAVVPHFWVVERMPIAGIDETAHQLSSSRRSIFSLRDDVAKRMARYYLDNVFEALDQPGQWYHDRTTGLVHYVPRPSDRLEGFTADWPLVDQFIIVAGDSDGGRPVHRLRFERITFRHSDWLDVERRHEPYDITEGLPDIEYASAPQASANVAGAVEFTDAHDCALVDTVIEHVGGYAVELGFGAQATLLVGNTLRDLGAGGVKLTGERRSDHPRANRDNVITDNEIAAGGQVFPAGIGVLIRHSAGNTVAHNHIHDFHYSGISCGWIWGYADNVAKDNHLDHNHIHDIGHGLLSDMGGIYVLGVQPGTTLRGNHIHDVHCANYGGWAIYLDEGSSHVVVEGNLTHDTSTQSFHQHYGRENIIRNNIFAFGGRSQITISRQEPHLSLTFERNIVVGNGRPGFGATEGTPPDALNIISDLNLFWDIAGDTELAGTGRVDVVDPDAPIVTFGNDRWRALGHDQHSAIGDPHFIDVAARDLRLADDSPARKLGFVPLSMADVGPRRPAARHQDGANRSGV